MALLSSEDRHAAEAIREILYCNPFGEKRIKWEREALGPRRFKEVDAYVFKPGRIWEDLSPNHESLGNLGTELAEKMRRKFIENPRASEAELRLYQDLILYVLYHRHRKPFVEAVNQSFVNK